MTIPSEYRIHFDRDYVSAHIKNYEAKGYLQVKPEKLHWAPFLIGRTLGQQADDEPIEVPLFNMAAGAGPGGTQPTGSVRSGEGSNADDVNPHSLQINGKAASEQCSVEKTNGDAFTDQVLLHEPGQPTVIVPDSVAEFKTDEAHAASGMVGVIQMPLSIPLHREKRSPSPTSTATSTPSRKARRTVGKHFGRTGSTRGMEPVVEIAASKMPLRATQRHLEMPIYADSGEGYPYSDEDAPGSDDPMIQ